MNENKARKLADFGVSELERIMPRSSEIEVDVIEDPVGHFSSHIKVMANHKVYFAKKESDSMYESFHKAMKALKHQLSKAKISHRGLKNLRFQEI